MRSLSKKERNAQPKTSLNLIQEHELRALSNAPQLCGAGEQVAPDLSITCHPPQTETKGFSFIHAAARKSGSRRVRERETQHPVVVPDRLQVDERLPLQPRANEISYLLLRSTNSGVAQSGT